jgi:hypothetical protein
MHRKHLWEVRCSQYVPSAITREITKSNEAMSAVIEVGPNPGEIE